MLPPLVLETVVNASKPTVWNAWSTTAGAKRAFAPDAMIELKVGGKYEIYFDLDEPPGLRGSEGCEILSYLPDEMLSFSWNAPPTFPVERNERTWVVVQLQQLTQTSTKITLTHLGWKEGGRQAELREYFRKAWPYVFQGIEKTLTE